MKTSPEVVIQVIDQTGRPIRCGWSGGFVHSPAGKVPLVVPIEVTYFDERNEEYAMRIKNEIEFHYSNQLIYEKEGDRWVEKRVSTKLYEHVSITCLPEECGKYKFFDYDLPIGVSRPRCPGCGLQSPVIMPDDGFPKRKKFFIKKMVMTEVKRKDKTVMKNVVRRDAEPYCYACDGRLSLILARPLIVPVDLLTDAQLDANKVTVIGRQNDEMAIH